MQTPSKINLSLGKIIVRYLKGTKEFDISYRSTSNPRLLGYTDSDWTWLVNDIKSTSGYAFSLGPKIFS